ncbi:thioesterase family protein [Mollisia scopiformis]|uniref:Thioesterase family protein n=1 Tax=Mollisia scopiformis TaxID=149040 RepID=A0A132B1C4_MOLSC|nr:thioesterase family protein [Mollisia scopiformis]KUJ06178.1 thioesterase family protein [Mollisia scopiformis]
MTRSEALSDLVKPWCKKVMDDPQWERLSTRAKSSNALFTETLWTDETICAHQSFYRSQRSENLPSGEIRVLLSLGSGLDGHPGICHGGFLSLIFDDTIHELAAKELPTLAVTVSLTVTFRQPVRTPALVVCRAWMEKVPVGRKAWIESTIEDGKGGVFASVASFILKIKENI